MERWKHLSTWEVVPGADPGQRDSEVSGSRDSPAVVHGHQVGDQDEGVSQHAGKELQEKQGSVGYSLFPSHRENPSEFHPREGSPLLPPPQGHMCPPGTSLGLWANLADPSLVAAGFQEHTPP